ncbi:MAG TPA: heme-binding protein [Kofleriaceae bacterium]|jgi:hypothetical protein
MADEPKLTPATLAPQGFRITEVDPKMRAPGPGRVPLLPPAPPILVPSLGPLAHFTGTWKGRGFNTIFRPNNGKTPTHLPSGIVLGDNVLELNLTEETLSFSSALGSVPNRGSGDQGDAFLNGVPYLQAINDITDPQRVTGIHLEPGIWAIVPTTTDPAERSTVTRMASIPHGTTVNAQGNFFTVAGGPQIDKVDITPSSIATGAKIAPPFPSQTAANTDTPRIPQDLTGTGITQAMLDDPNSVLRDAIAGQHITQTTVISIATTPPPPLFDGGTTNIAFLRPNARTVQMSATFWIETVAHTIRIPVHQPGLPLHVQPVVRPGQVAPTIELHPPPGIPVGHLITVTTFQIQYTQTVVLDFAGLHWPHVSVATLVPSAPIPTPIAWP